MDWHEVKCCLRKVGSMNHGLDMHGGADLFSCQGNGVECGSPWPALPQNVFPNEERRIEPQDAWWTDLQTSIQQLHHAGTRKVVETWYVSKNRIHVSLQSREVRMYDSMTPDAFVQACRNAWYDLDNGRECELPSGEAEATRQTEHSCTCHCCARGKSRFPNCTLLWDHIARLA